MAVNCGEPTRRRDISFKYNSTLFGSELLFWCEDGLLKGDVTTAQCIVSGKWRPNPSEVVCLRASSGKLKYSATLNSYF